MVTRLLAVVAAGALILGAVAVRARIDTGEPGQASGGGNGTVVCATELAAVCESLAEDDTRVEEAGRTLDGLGSAGPGDADVWVTLQPWPAMARDRRARAGLDPVVGEDGDVVARSPLVLVVWQDRADVLTRHCGETTWDCLGGLAPGTWADAGGPSSWGPLKPGHADPSSSATGLLVLGQATASRLGTSGFTRRDLDESAFFGWFTGLERAVPDFRPSSGSPLLAMVQFGPSRYDVVGDIDAVATSLLERTADRAGGLVVQDSEPAMVAEVVVVALRDQDALAGRVRQEAAEVLTQRGWQQSGPGGGLPSESGLPEPGALEALRAMWSEVMR